MITIITKELVDRINALSRKQRSEGLTDEEKAEQQQLRQQYLKGIRSQVVDQLSRIKYVEDEQPGKTGDCGCGCGGHHHHGKDHKDHQH